MAQNGAAKPKPNVLILGGEYGVLLKQKMADFIIPVYTETKCDISDLY